MQGEGARVGRGAYVCTHTRTGGSYARGRQSAPVRPESKLSSSRGPAVRCSPLSLTRRERVHQRTHTQAGTRAESRSQSPAVGGRFDVADAAATFTTLNTFISRSDILPLRSPSLAPTPPPPSRFLRLLCSCTTLSTSFRNSSRCPRALNFTPCRDS